MSPQNILILVLILISFDYLFNQILDYLNYKAQKPEIPGSMKDYYDGEKYRKSLDYHKTISRFSFLTSAFSFVLSFALLTTGAFGLFDHWLATNITSTTILSLAFFGILFVVSDILNIPFQLYSTFVIEEKFGFNKTTIKTFWIDKIKGYLLSAIIGGGILWLLLYLIFKLGPDFWIIFWVAIGFFTLFINMFYTSLIVPLFNKLSPLEEGDLKSALQDYAQKVKFPLKSIFVIDGSKRSNKSNAFFSGLGRKKKIVLYDTLIKNHSVNELVAVLAHEVGHYKKKHIVWGYLITILQAGLMLFIMSKMIFNENLSLALGGTNMAIHLNLLAFTILFSPISKLLGIAMNMYSRKNEFEADAYALSTYESDSLQVALKKLSVDNLSNLFPHPWYVFFNYSHPPLLKRLEAIESSGKL